MLRACREPVNIIILNMICSRLHNGFAWGRVVTLPCRFASRFSQSRFATSSGQYCNLEQYVFKITIRADTGIRGARLPFRVLSGLFDFPVMLFRVLLGWLDFCFELAIARELQEPAHETDRRHGVEEGVVPRDHGADETKGSGRFSHAEANEAVDE